MATAVLSQMTTEISTSSASSVLPRPPSPTYIPYDSNRLKRKASVLQVREYWQVHVLALLAATGVLILTLATVLSLTCVFAALSLLFRGCAWCCNSAGVSGLVQYMFAGLSFVAFIHWGLSVVTFIVESDSTRLISRWLLAKMQLLAEAPRQIERRRCQTSTQ